MRFHRTKIPASRGFSMIEVLIAVLVLAIGLLGVAALQMTSLNSGMEGYFRTQATSIAEDLASRIKSSRSAAEYSPKALGVTPAEAMTTYLTEFTTNPYVCEDDDTPAKFCRPDEATDNAGEACTTDEQILFDQWESCTGAQNLLPGGQVGVIRSGVRLSIAVAWDAVATNKGAGEESDIRNPICNSAFNIATQKDCVVIEVIP